MSGHHLIVLFRHGIAQDKDLGIPDEQRRLTDEGNEKMQRIAPGFARIVPELEAIYSSPLVRALETAEWLAKAYDRKFEVRTTAALRPAADVREFRQLLDELGARCAVFVGHEPNLSELMVDLTGIRSDGELSLKKGGCYGIRVDPKDARLEWMLTPKILAA